MQSHIFPKLIYKRIRSHPKSRFRSLDNFSKAMQDGEKRPMLCHDCEERFSAFESKFATLFLDPYLESEKLKNLHSTWVNYYFLSVAWRVLWDDLYRMKSHCEHFSRHIFEEYCDELGKCLLAFKDGANSKIPKQFKTRVYKLNRLIKQSEVNELAKGCIFGYSVFLAKSHSFSVIVYYAGLVFVTDYIPDKRRYIFLGGKPTLFKTRCKKKEVTEELKIQFCEMAQQYKKVMTPDMRKKISERYNKWCAKGIFSVDTRQKSIENFGFRCFLLQKCWKMCGSKCGSTAWPTPWPTREIKLYPRKWTRDFDPWSRSADTHLTHRGRSAAPVLW